MNTLIRLKKTAPVLVIAFVLAWFALSPTAQAVVPPPDGGYPGFNTAEGQNALFSLTTGAANTAVGWFSLSLDATGSFNTATGAGSLLFNTGDNNTAFGAAALLFNTTGSFNTAVGTAALSSNTTGGYNTAIGREALPSNTIGGFNTAVGDLALSDNTEGLANTATGGSALLHNTTGGGNTAHGYTALEFNTTGRFNTAVGGAALQNNISGVGNTALGINAGSNVTTADNVICIGSFGANVSNSCYIRNIYGVTTQSGTTAPVVVSDGGQLGTLASSERFKKNIAAMEKTSEAILSLRPVTFHYKTDTKGIPQFGLIAEEVAKVNPALVLPDKEGKPYTVRYDAVNAMLLNEFLKEHRKVEELKSAMAQQRKETEVLVARLNEQEARIQKVSAQVEASKPAPRVVNNP